MRSNRSAAGFSLEKSDFSGLQRIDNCIVADCNGVFCIAAYYCIVVYVVYCSIVAGCSEGL